MEQYFLRELKEQGIIKITWRSIDEMTSDIFSLRIYPLHYLGIMDITFMVKMNTIVSRRPRNKS